MRKLARSTSILDFIYKEINPIDEEFDRDFILKLIKRGDFIFFFDGYDEIPFGERESVTESLQDFISKANNNYFIMTSRPEGALASFSDFQRFSIQPLQLSEAFELLRKYDQSGELSEEIISKLKGRILENIQEFLVNPLLVSLLFKSYEYKRTFPLKTHIFYRQVYDALFESHDLSKPGGFIREKYSGLDIDEFHRVLRALGFITVKLGQIEFEKDRWLNLIRTAKGRCLGIDFKEGSFLKDLLTTVPLFNRDGEYYKWAHKSIQEYFAAQFISIDTKSKQDSILTKMLEKSNPTRFYNVLALCYDIDYKTFRRVIIYEVLNKFLKYYKSSYTAIDKNRIDKHAINIRKSLTYQIIYGFLSPDWDEASVYDGSEIDLLDRFIEESGYRAEDFELVAWGGQVEMFYYNHNEREILNLLDEKGVDVFFNFKNKDRMISINDRERASKQINAELTSGTALLVDDDPSSLINQSNLFELVNRLILEDVELVLNYDKCLFLRRQIQKEIEEDKSDSFFIDNM